MQRLSFTPQHCLLQIDLFLFSIFTSVNMIPTEREQICVRCNTPVNSLDYFTNRQRRKKPIHRLFKLGCVARHRGMYVHKREVYFLTHVEARGETGYVAPELILALVSKAR